MGKSKKKGGGGGGGGQRKPHQSPAQPTDEFPSLGSPARLQSPVSSAQARSQPPVSSALAGSQPPVSTPQHHQQYYPTSDQPPPSNFPVARDKLQQSQVLPTLPLQRQPTSPLTAAALPVSPQQQRQPELATAPAAHHTSPARNTLPESSGDSIAFPSKWKPKVPYAPYVTQEVNVAKQLATLKIKEDCHGDGGLMPPNKRKDGTFPGRSGKPCSLDVNHFPLGRTTDIKEIHQYFIRIVPPWIRPYSKKDSELYREIFHKWTALHPVIRRTSKPQWGKINYGCAFNGNNVFYSTTRIKGDIHDLEEPVVLPEHPSLSFYVKDVKYTNSMKVSEEMQRFFELGRRAYTTDLGGPQDILNALDIILNQAVRLNHLLTSVGRSYFHQDGDVLDVGFGKEVWIGTFTSVRPHGWKSGGLMLTLNADVSNKPAVKSLHLTRESRPGAADSYIHRMLPKSKLDFRQGLSPQDTNKIDWDLRGLKVKYELPNGNKRTYKMNKLVGSACSQIIPSLNKSVEEYFKEEHQVNLKFPLMPCLHLGSITKTIYIPAELCFIDKQALPSGKKLPDQSVATMIRGTAARPELRKNKILDGLQRNNKIYQTDPFAKEFGISIQSQMAKINGRVLEPPGIGYKPTQKGKTESILTLTQPGSWRPTPFKHLYMDGKRLNNWALLDLCHLSDKEYSAIIQGFVRIGDEVGLSMSSKPESLWHQKSTPATMEQDFKTVVQEYAAVDLKLDAILVIFPTKGGVLYDTIKYLGDIVHKIPTQCMIRTTILKGGVINNQVISNICLKLNSKLGGINHVLSTASRPPALKRPVMIMGADVSHAPPESKGVKPSIAAVVGSIDAKASKYECEVRIQKRENNEEIICDMKDVTKSLLLKFYRQTKYKPERIIMFRDGISEGQFLTVLSFELKALREACFELDQNYQPKITYLVVQKRHHTRLFAADNNRYKNGNVLAGTVVDQGLNHPTEGDFYLVSHEGIQGTSRPTHYQVLWDDAEMSADEIEQLTYYLCHLYSRCSRSVSYPSPTYYSHLAADRARKHHNDMLIKGIREDQIKRTIEHDNIKIMYFV